MRCPRVMIAQAIAGMERRRGERLDPALAVTRFGRQVKARRG